MPGSRPPHLRPTNGDLVVVYLTSGVVVSFIKDKSSTLWATLATQGRVGADLRGFSSAVVLR